jgi:O-antigen/teichoic acid export membrane protein
MNKENRPKVNLFTLLLHIFIVLSISVIILTLSNTLSHLFNEPGLIKVAQILPILCILTIPRTYAMKLLYRDQQLNRVFTADLVHFGAMTIITFYFFLLKNHLTFYEMIIIYLGGTAAGSIFILFVIRKKLLFNLNGNFSIREFIKFGTPLMFQSGSHAMPKLLDIYFVQYFFGTTSVGIYSSAKTLYRVFDEAAHATYGLLYPTAVRQYDYGNFEELKSLITKSTSFMLFTFIALVIMLESGLSEFIITNFLPDKYRHAIPIFNLMIIASIGLPFVMSSLIINAEGKPQIVLLFTTISLMLSIISYFLLGSYEYFYLMPIGLIIYNFAFGFMCYFYLKRKYKLSVASLFRAFGDVSNYLKKISTK